MGKASTLKGIRRQAGRDDLKKMEALYAEKSALPEVVAEHEAAAADEELQARWRADLPGQQERLLADGWKRVWEGDDGAGGWAHPRRGLKMIHSVNREADGNLWAHFSLSARDNTLPGWYRLRDTQWVMYPGLVGVQVVAPPSSHVNIAEVAHIWTCLTASVIPDFGRHGTI